MDCSAGGQLLKLSSFVVDVLSQEWGGDLSEADIQRMAREMTGNEVKALATLAGLVQKHLDVLAPGRQRQASNVPHLVSLPIPAC